MSVSCNKGNRKLYRTPPPDEIPPFWDCSALSKGSCYVVFIPYRKEAVDHFRAGIDDGHRMLRIKRESSDLKKQDLETGF